MVIENSPTIERYKQEIYECTKLFMPNITRDQIESVLDYSINKRYKNDECSIVNSYTNKTANMTLLAVTDYIASREPIVTAFGTMFRKHGEVPNPLATVVQGFLDKRAEDKKMMFKFPKGSEDFEKYNLLQALDKIDANGIYGVLGMYTSLVYNINTCTSITSQGRSLVSSMTMFFESFLANNVKFGSLNEVLTFIRNVKKERYERKYNDFALLDNPCVSTVDCFVKVVMTCGYRWIPDENELEIIWTTINNLSQQDINRVYYKNNLYEFMSNSSMKRAITHIMRELDEPIMNPAKPPKNVIPALDELTSILEEFVYYRYMIIDRIDRCDNMIKSVTMISDTDSTIVSLDAWYRFNLEYLKDVDFKIKKITANPIYFLEKDEFDDWDMGDKTTKKHFEPIYEMETEYDYDFFSDELVELKHTIDPITELPQDNIRHSILNILAYVLDRLVNDYMERYCKNNHSFQSADIRKCKILAKNEFTFRRVLMTPVKKNYASIQEVQEGNIVPEDKQLDIKGIASMAKSSMAESTREALKKILYEDILKTPAIDQFRVIKHIAILEKEIMNSVYDGSKEFYKPVTVKAASSYNDPMRIQGVKASIVWNALKDASLPGINLDERNAVDIAKVKIDKNSINKIKDKYPEVYEKALELLSQKEFKGFIDSIAIPLDVAVPDWVLELLDYATIVNNNVGGFVYDSIGIKRFGRNKVNYTNILQL